NISFAQLPDSPMNLIMPRSVPGAYSMVKYDRYVSRPVAVGANNRQYALEKADGPIWKLTSKTGGVRSLPYEVKIKKMEQDELFATDYSVLRSGYAGILNYSVFGWVEGTQEQPVQCTVQTFPGWSIYSTVQPKENPDKGSYEFSCKNYYELADGQT